MRCKSLFAAAVALPLLAAGAQGVHAGSNLIGIWGGHSNDTGGIIPFTPETARIYRDIAAAECARWDKVAYITSVHPVYGDYIGYVCHFPRNYDPRKAGQWIWHF
jgi:hypothetical protein